MVKNPRGAVAYVHYKGGITGGEMFDDCSQGDPVKIVLGVGELPMGMDEAFLHMEVGEERTIVMEPRQAYGDVDPEGIKTYPRQSVEAFEKIDVGDILSWTNPASGIAIPVRCIGADKTTVTIDFNHPLAGKQLTYWLKLESIEPYDTARA